MNQYVGQIESFLHNQKINPELYFLNIQDIFHYIEKEEEPAFIEDVFYVFRTSVHSISQPNYLNKILGILKFIKKHNINDLKFDSNNLLCFSFPLRHQAYIDFPEYSEDLVKLYELFFNKDDIFLKNNSCSYGIGQTIMEIKEFLKYGFSNHPKHLNESLFCNLTILNYFYDNHYEWLSQFKTVPELTNIRKRFAVEDF